PPCPPLFCRARARRLPLVNSLPFSLRSWPGRGASEWALSVLADACERLSAVRGIPRQDTVIGGPLLPGAVDLLPLGVPIAEDVVAPILVDLDGDTVAHRILVVGKNLVLRAVDVFHAV